MLAFNIQSKVMVVRPVHLVAAAMILSLAIAGCSNQSDQPKDPNLLTVWTTEDQAERA